MASLTFKITTALTIVLGIAASIYIPLTLLKEKEEEQKKEEEVTLEIKWKPLSENKTYVNNKDRFKYSLGSYYSQLLVDPDHEETKGWWTNKFKELKEDKRVTFPFILVQDGYSKENPTALNQACKYLYKQLDPFYNIQHKGFQDIETFFLNFWKYCSAVETKPISLYEANVEVDELFNYADLLVSTEENHNISYWNIKNKWFSSLNNIEEELKIFVDKQTDKSLKNICSLIYQETSNLDPKIILKYCSFTEN